MTLIARLFDEEANAFRPIAHGEISNAFARAALIICPHTGCSAEMRPIGPATCEGDPNKTRRGHFNTKDHHAHDPKCPEGAATPELKKIKSICDALDEGLPVLVNLDFDTGLNPRKPVADVHMTRIGYEWQTMRFETWQNEQQRAQGHKGQTHVAVAMHDTQEVLDLLDRAERYAGGKACAELLFFQTSGIVQPYHDFVVADDKARLKKTVHDIADAYAFGAQTVQAAPKLFYFSPSKKSRGNTVNGYKAVGSDTTVSTLPIAHYFDVQVHLPSDIARARFLEKKSDSAIIARPYLLGDDARKLKLATARNQGILDGYPLHLFLQVTNYEQFVPLPERTQQLVLPMAKPIAAENVEVAQKIAALRHTEQTRRSPRIA